MCCREKCIFVRKGSLALGYIKAIISSLVFLLLTAASITWIVDKNLIVRNLLNNVFNNETIELFVNSARIEADWWSFMATGWIMSIVHGVYAVFLIKGVKRKKDALILSYFNYSVIVNVVLIIVSAMLLIYGFLLPFRKLCFMSIVPSAFVMFDSILLIMVWQTYQQMKIEHALDIVEKRLYMDYVTDIDKGPPPRASFGSQIYDDPGNFDVNQGRSIQLHSNVAVSGVRPLYNSTHLI